MDLRSYFHYRPQGRAGLPCNVAVTTPLERAPIPGLLELHVPEERASLPSPPSSSELTVPPSECDEDTPAVPEGTGREFRSVTPGPQGLKLWRLCSRQGSPELHCSRGHFQSFTLILGDKKMVPELMSVSDANQCRYEGTSPQPQGPHSPRGLQTTGQSRPTRALCTLLAASAPA